MRRWRISVVCATSMTHVCSATAIAEAEQTVVRFQTDRWNEEWSGDGVPFWKGMPVLGGAGSLSLGADSYFRLEHKDPFAFGTTSERARTNLLGRALVHANLRAGSELRTYIEVGLWDQAGKPDAVTVDEADLALQRAFIDWTPTSDLAIRAGRQDIFDRSSRLLRPADAVNYQQVFDAVRVQFGSATARTEIYIGEPFLPRDGYFEQSDLQGDALWTGGSHQRTSQTIKGLSYGVYGAWIDRDSAAYLATPGNEHRGMAVARMSYRDPVWRVSVEYGRQFGSNNGNRIDAWAFATEFGGNISKGGRLKANVRFDGASGDLSETTANESWGPVFPGMFYLGRSGVYNPTNAMGFFPELSWQASPDLRLALVGEEVWRVSDGASFASPGGRPLLAKGTPGDAHILSGGKLTAQWRVSDSHEVRTAIFRLSPEGAFRKAGGETIDGLVMSLISRF